MFSIILMAKTIIPLKNEVLEKIADSIVNDFCSQDKRKGIVVVGGTESQRRDVVLALIPKVDVFVYTLEQFPPNDLYNCNIEDYLNSQTTS